MEYWVGLPEEHKTALFQLREEDFAAELDAHLKYQLRICRDCRGNVYRAYRELKGKEGPQLEVCDAHSLTFTDGVVVLTGNGDNCFFERAEEVEECKVSLQPHACNVHFSTHSSGPLSPPQGWHRVMSIAYL